MSINGIDCLYAGCPKALMEEMLKCDDLLKYEIQEYELQQQSTNTDTCCRMHIPRGR